MENKIRVCGGCNAKIAASDLDKYLKNLSIYEREDVLIGFAQKEDAAVIEVGNELVVCTMDFFPPMVSDPYIFGKIAATNAISDIYAMGAEPVSAMNMVCFPQEENKEILSEILRGGAEVVASAKATLCGGHSIHDHSIKYGLSVTGKTTKDRLWRNNTPREGDVLFLTKALGISLLMTGNNISEISEQEYNNAIESMLRSNGGAKKVLEKFNPSAVTDVTGFGLLGHLYEMTSDKFTAVIENVPILDGALRMADNFYFTAGGQRNRDFLNGKVEFVNKSKSYAEVLFDPQTSGGFLISMPEEKANDFEIAMKNSGELVFRIGKIGRYLGVSSIIK